MAEEGSRKLAWRAWQVSLRIGKQACGELRPCHDTSGRTGPAGPSRGTQAGTRRSRYGDIRHCRFSTLRSDPAHTAEKAQAAIEGPDRADRGQSVTGHHCVMRRFTSYMTRSASANAAPALIPGRNSQAPQAK